jgi:AbrB family looped-hinge helix DNA binding protein
MRVTERGQVTIPKRLRRRFGIDANTDVEFVEQDGALLLVKRAPAGFLDRFAGKADAPDLPATTDELLAELRDETAS